MRSSSTTTEYRAAKRWYPGGVLAARRATMVAVEKAPDFRCLDAAGNERTLADYAGRKLLLLFVRHLY